MRVRQSQHRLKHTKGHACGSAGGELSEAFESWDRIEDACRRLNRLADLIIPLNPAQEFHKNTLLQAGFSIWDQTEIIRRAAEELYRLAKRGPRGGRKVSPHH